MIVYISMLLLSLACMYEASKQADSKKKYLYCFLAFLPFLLVSGFRFGVGTDYIRRYYVDFSRIIDGQEITNLEPGFYLMLKANVQIADKPYLLFFVCSLLINGFIFFVIAKESKDKILSVCIYFFLGFFFDSLNIMRQYLAISIVFIGYYYLLKDKSKGRIIFFIASVIVASLFHSTALITLALLLCNYKVLFSYKWFLPCLAVILALNTRLMSILQFFLENTRFNVYFSGKLFKGEVSYLFIAENLFFYLFLYFLYKKGYVKQDKKSALFVNTQALALLCMCLGACHMLFIRVAFYFSNFQIISVPYFLSHYKKTYTVFIKNKPIHIDIVKTVIVCCLLFAFYRTNIQTNVNAVLPYRTIFTKDWLIY